MDRGDILSAEELRKRLYMKFKNNGIFDNLRSQLRKKLVLELDGNKVTSVTKNTKTSEQTSALLLQVINWLVGDHLKTYEYNYTLSVFAAEIGTLNRAEEMFSLKDVLRLLNVHPDSEFYRNMLSTKASERENSLLFYFLQMLGIQIKQDECESKHQSCQTESEKPSVAYNLRMKLQQVEDFYVLKKSASKLEFEGNVESQLIKYKKCVEEKLRKELSDELTSFKDHEILSIKMVEREKCREELKIKANQLEKEHRDKMEELVEREIAARRHLDTIKEALERDIFNQRQEILSQLESTRQQELDARRLAERIRIDFDMEKSKLDNREEKLKMRENVLNDKEKSIDENVRQLVVTQRLEEREELLERTKQLSQRESEVENRRIELENEREKYGKLNSECNDQIKNVKEIEDEIRKVKETNRKLEFENKSLAVDVSRLAKYETSVTEFETVKSQLRETVAERDELLLRVHSLNSQLSLPSSEVLSLKRQLEVERDNRRLDRGLWDEQRRRFDAKLDAALDSNKSLALRIDEVVAINSQLHSVIDNLRAELHRCRINLHESVHGETFYDTTLDGARLPPELQLQMSSWTPSDMRLAALEKETEYLHRRIQHIRIPAKNFDLSRSSEQNNVFNRSYNKNNNNFAHYFVPDESVNLNSTRLDDVIEREVDKRSVKSDGNEEFKEFKEFKEDLEENKTRVVEKRSVKSDESEEFKEFRGNLKETETLGVEEADKMSNSVQSDEKNGGSDWKSEDLVENREDEVVPSAGNVNLDSLWEEREKSGENDIEISGADESQHDLDDW